MIGLDRKLKLGNKLKNLREACDMSVREVGIAVDKSRVAYLGYENDHAYPNAETVLKMCKLFGISPNELLGWKDN